NARPVTILTLRSEPSRKPLSIAGSLTYVAASRRCVTYDGPLEQPGSHPALTKKWPNHEGLQILQGAFGVARHSLLLILLSFIAFPAAAQLTDGGRSPTSKRNCYGPAVVLRPPAGGLIIDDSNLFQLQADGTYRMRRFCPLFRPSRHKGR